MRLGRKASWPRTAGAFCVFLSFALSGCSNRNGPPRVAVEGTVTLDGVALERGSILFIPIGDTVGPEAGCAIENGRYDLPEDRGPVLGRLRVEIRAEQELGFDPTEPEQTVQHIGVPWPKNRIPEHYNDRSDLVVETTATGSAKFDFALHSSP